MSIPSPGFRIKSGMTVVFQSTQYVIIKAMNGLDKKEIIAFLRTIKPQLQEVGIEKIGIFGSVARDEADLFSDIDIMIRTSSEFARNFEGARGFIYLDELRKTIERRFNRAVDICDESGLKKKFRGVIYA